MANPIVEAIRELDRKLTPGPIARWHQTHYANIRQRAEALSTPDLIAEIEQHESGETARLLIAALSIVDLIGTHQTFVKDLPIEATIGFLAAAVPTAVLIGPHRGIVKIHDRKIMEEKLNRRRQPDAIG